MPSRRRKTVAVVDDDPSVLKATETLLEAHGFDVIGFSSAEDFLDRSQAEQLDCLLLDINLSGLSGLDLRHRLSELGSPFPVIFMTALDCEVMRGRALRSGCAAFLRKPFEANQLVDALAKALPAS
jgi:FixJ family two-component response regulator